jgi:hypothetical protein
MEHPHGVDPQSARGLTSARQPASASEAAYRLSGFLNGTHRGTRMKGARSFPAAAVVDAVRSVEPSMPEAAGEPMVLGGDEWTPHIAEEIRLRESLGDSLAAEGIVDLVVFGSLARGSTTGFSDVDAVLIVEDDHVRETSRLRRLRRHALAAGRSVLAYQPMQHHGFIVATPQLLAHPATLGLPREALETTASLHGKSHDATVRADNPVAAFRAHVRALNAVTAWPKHVWVLHRTVAAFELAPALYLQATGRPSPKHASFEASRAEFGDAWAPYDVLEQVRLTWPREREVVLQQLAQAIRNPWTAAAIRRRLPAAVPTPVAALLDEHSLAGLRELLGLMSENIP